ncbi:tyrosine recombinase XerS [Paenibacillus terrae]|uniref:Integrase n=1 Tax=Paenibacillus terrae TaxID=159743 RepID=A0A0D7WWQ3_9BACL|nr:tyrosine recombinase XerS [Paenibacillus terrae]KJD43600.1 integrase [Paenibacillus terrae]
MPPIQKIKDREVLLNKLSYMPWYVDKFINYKLPDLSPSSLLEYIYDYETFFNYLLAEGLAPAGPIRQIPIETLEKLSLDSIHGYRSHLLTKAENSKTTVSRKLSSLRTLFNYLNQKAEDENFNPLLIRNVMAKVDIRKKKNPKETAASSLAGKLLQDNEITEFVEYIFKGYEKNLAGRNRALLSYKFNRVRDTCIVSLILNSGLRVSETVNLDVDDIDLTKQSVYVYRKGADDQIKSQVYFREEAIPYLKEYLLIRDVHYKSPKKEKGLFLTIPNGQIYGSRMTKRAIQNMIIKYAEGFGKPFLTVHKLRHSFATDYYLANDLYKTQTQLGHSSPETTQIYAHLTDKTMSEAIDKRK